MPPVIFFGSAHPFSTIVLQKLIDAKFPILAAITLPDKPAGRHLELTPNPVKILAKKNGLTVYEDLKSLSMDLFDKGPIGLVAAYGKILKKELLDKFSGRIYNIHPSLLPKYRGPSPLQQQILDGISETGVTIIQMDELMDHGPIVAIQKDSILPTDTWTSLGERLFTKGAELFVSKVESLDTNPRTQDHNQTSYTHLLDRNQGFIPYDEFTKVINSRNPEIDRKLRAFTNWPGVWTLNPQQKRLKLISLTPEVTVQLEGKKPTTWQG